VTVKLVFSPSHHTKNNQDDVETEHRINRIIQLIIVLIGKKTSSSQKPQLELHTYKSTSENCSFCSGYKHMLKL